MDLKNKLFNPKKIPYYFAVGLLTTGAGLILGLLSFGGMYAILPILPLAFASFALSVAYEGEIYLQNIKGALNKLFKSNYLQNYLAKEYLLKNFPKETNDPACPQFFKDYLIQLKRVSAFDHKELNSASKKRKKLETGRLRDMEHWFAKQLFATAETSNESTYVKQLNDWLRLHDQAEWQNKIAGRRTLFNVVKGFSVLSALFMTLSTTYLAVEAFTIIPFFAAIPFATWPLMIAPMAIVAGAAYGMLTYNAVTDLINNNTLVEWYKKIRNDVSKNGFTVRNVFMSATAVVLVALALALTICTAGTWWTVASNARPLFDWMRKMPSVVMGVINPIIVGTSSLSFIIQNTAESLDMVDDAIKSEQSIFQKMYAAIVSGFQHVRNTENWLQMLNPARLLIKLTITPLRVLLFLGHLISIGVTADRMPGVSQIVAALIAIISEGFEDVHYFMGHEHEHHIHEHHDHEHHDHDHQHEHDQQLLKERLAVGAGHNHDMDIPTWLLKIVASPLYALAAGWDSAASQLNKSAAANEASSKQVLTFANAWNKQRGIQEEEEVALAVDEKTPSKEWQVEHTVALIENRKRQLRQAHVGQELALAKVSQLDILKDTIRRPQNVLADTLKQAKNQPVYNQHRLFAQANEKTSTQEFIENLPERVNAI